MTKTVSQEHQEYEHLQFRIPKQKWNDFNNLVLAKYGMKHGAKTALFLDLIEEYQLAQQIELLKREIEQLEQAKREVRNL